MPAEGLEGDKGMNLTGLESSIQGLITSAIRLGDVYERQRVIQEELNHLYRSYPLWYRILGWLFPRMYDFRSDVYYSSRV